MGDGGHGEATSEGDAASTSSRRLRDRFGRWALGATDSGAVLPWLTVLLVPLAWVVGVIPFRVYGWCQLTPTGIDGPLAPGARLIPAQLASLAWYGAALGLGLVVADRVAIVWRRPLRWALGAGVGALLPTLFLPVLLIMPTTWAELRQGLAEIRINGVREVLMLPRSWQECLFFLALFLAAAAAGWWLGRAAPADGRPFRKLALAGALIGSVAALQWLPARPVLALSVIGESAIVGALSGVALAVALSRSRGRRAVPADSARPSA